MREVGRGNEEYMMRGVVDAVLITAEELEKAGVPEDVRDSVLQSVNSRYITLP